MRLLWRYHRSPDDRGQVPNKIRETYLHFADGKLAAEPQELLESTPLVFGYTSTHLGECAQGITLSRLRPNEQNASADDAIFPAFTRY
jgi:hypothetical protein